MSAEWKPGDVAMVTGRWAWNEPHSTRRAFRDDECWTIGNRDILDHEVSVVRPLVVIDPEDPEQVKRLAHPLWEELETLGSRDFHALIPRVQAALREFADPTPPKPDEPMGLGAVVEDAEGQTWLRDWKGLWRAPDLIARWSKVEAVRVLSEGVQP